MSCPTPRDRVPPQLIRQELIIYQGDQGDQDDLGGQANQYDQGGHSGQGDMVDLGDKGDQGGRREQNYQGQVSIIIFRMLESSGFGLEEGDQSDQGDQSDHCTHDEVSSVTVSLKSLIH